MSGTKNALTEWRSFWFLPLMGALGYATSVLHVYSLGPFIAPLQAEFGWSRALISFGLTVSSVLSAILCVPVGMLVDRVGPRRVALVGIVLMCGAFSLLGTATGEKANWYALWAVIAVGTFGVQATVWTSAVASRFEKSRGMAFAIALSGGSLAAAIFPLYATWAIEAFGWRRAYPAMAAAWGVPVFILMVLLFRGAHDHRTARVASQATATGVSLAEGVRSSAFWRLLMASAFFAFTTIGVTVHFVPILTDKGVETLDAAGVAALIGIFSVVGRLGTGFLIDRFAAHKVGAVIFLIPLLSCTLLLGDIGGRPGQMLAAAIFGLTLGAEVDVIAYLATRFFGLKNFGALYGAMVMALSLGTAFGPLAAGAVFDANASYTPFLYLTMILMSTAALSLATLGRPPALTASPATAQ
jgi:MFS family permease